MRGLRFPTKEFICAIHDVLELSGHGFISEDNLDFLEANTSSRFLESVGASELPFEDQVAYLASYYLFHIITGHPFVDGNKRTAFLTMTTIFTENALMSKYDEEKVSVYLVKINNLIQNGSKPRVAIQAFERDLGGTTEYVLLNLLFDLAAAHGDNIYKNSNSIFAIVRQLLMKEESFEVTSLTKGYAKRVIRLAEELVRSLKDKKQTNKTSEDTNSSEGKNDTKK